MYNEISTFCQTNASCLRDGTKCFLVPGTKNCSCQHEYDYNDLTNRSKCVFPRAIVEESNKTTDGGHAGNAFPLIDGIFIYCIFIVLFILIIICTVTGLSIWRMRIHSETERAPKFIEDQCKAYQNGPHYCNNYLEQPISFDHPQASTSHGRCLRSSLIWDDDNFGHKPTSGFRDKSTSGFGDSRRNAHVTCMQPAQPGPSHSSPDQPFAAGSFFGGADEQFSRVKFDAESDSDSSAGSSDEGNVYLTPFCSLKDDAYTSADFDHDLNLPYIFASNIPSSTIIHSSLTTI